MEEDKWFQVIVITIKIITIIVIAIIYFHCHDEDDGEDGGSLRSMLERLHRHCM